MTRPHWHDQNPWKYGLLYVPVLELAECHIKIGEPFNIWTSVDAIAHWVQYGTKLDAYILNAGPLMSAGVRYGPEGHHYLTPPFSLPKLMALREKYLNPPTSGAVEA